MTKCQKKSLNLHYNLPTKIVINTYIEKILTPKDNISTQKTTDFSGLQTPLHRSPERLFPERPDATELSISCYRGDYSASRIARAVEDADAHLLNLNLTSEVMPTGEIVVDLRISHRSASSVVRSLERYGFNVVSVRDSIEEMNDTFSTRVAELLAHINV